MQDPAEFRQPVDAPLERRLERLGLTGKEDTWADRYLLCEHIVDPHSARSRQRYEAVARFTRDLIAHRWVKTREARERANPKRVYYLSLEFLIGRLLNNNLINLAAHPLVERAHRFARHPPVPGRGLRAPISVRHLPAVDPQRLSGRAPG